MCLMKKLLHLKSHAMISKTVKERLPCLGRNCLNLELKAHKNNLHSISTSYQLTVCPDLRFYPVNEEWQQQACNILGIEFVAPSNFASRRGGPDTILTCRSLNKIIGDGNCLFRAFCNIITGSKQQHFALRSAIVYHMLSFPNL